MGNRPGLLRVMYESDYSSNTMWPILDEIFRQTSSSEEEDALADKARDAIWDCETEQEVLEAAKKVLRDN